MKRRDHLYGVRSRPRPRRMAAVVVAGVAVLTAACGDNPSSAGSGGSTGVGTPTATHLANTQKALAFSRCMRTNGVPDFPDPSTGTTGAVFPKATLAQLAAADSRYPAAERSCQHLLPIPSVAQERSEATQALRFSRCMRDHGVANFPDPAGDGQIPDPASLGINQGSPQFEAANEACGQYRPPYMPSNAAYNAWASAHASS